MLQVTGNKNTEEKYCSLIYLERGQHGECSLQSKKKETSVPKPVKRDGPKNSNPFPPIQANGKQGELFAQTAKPEIGPNVPFRFHPLLTSISDSPGAGNIAV